MPIDHPMSHLHWMHRAVRRAASLLAVVVLATPLAAQPAGASLEERLDWLGKQIDSRRESQNIAGLSIAIVLDGETIYARGFGQRDVELGIPAQADTIYCIGSTTKHMTAALVAQMEAEGRLSLDEHPARLVPGFSLSDEDANANVNLRDLLSHRTGLTRMSLLWYGGTSSFDEMLAGVPRAELYAPFRTEFLYNNVMYAVAGEAAARSADTTWPRLMRDRLFEPAGMTDATNSGYTFMDRTRSATGYQWDGDAEEFEALPLRHLDTIGPAGSTYATVLDMAEWAKTLLNDGVAPNGTRVLAPGVFETITTEHIAMGGDTQYGLGLFIRSWNGHRVVEHGGNIDGFASAFALLPERNAGVSVLMNASSAPLQSQILDQVWNTLFPEDVEINDADEPGDDNAPFDPAAEDLSRFTGSYPANPLPFDVTVEEREGGLAFVIAGQPEAPLTPPETRNGRWLHEGVPPFSIRFVESDDDGVLGMIFQQGPVEMPVAREGRSEALSALLTERSLADAPYSLDELQRFLGAYHFAIQGIDFSIVERNGRLAVDIPGQTAFELNWPDDEGWWVLKNIPGARIRFEPEGDSFSGITFEQAGSSFDLPRVLEGSDDLPTTDEVLARLRDALGTERWEQGLAVRLDGRSALRHQGIEGEYTLFFAGTDTLASSDDMSPFAHARAAISPDDAWNKALLGTLDDLDDDGRLTELFSHPATWASGWDERFERVTVRPRREVEGRSLLPVRFESSGDAEMVLFIDETSWLPAAMEVVGQHPMLGRRVQRVELSDYRDVSGAMIPMGLSTELLQNGEYTVELTGAEVIDALPPESLARP